MHLSKNVITGTQLCARCWMIILLLRELPIQLSRQHFHVGKLGFSILGALDILFGWDNLTGGCPVDLIGCPCCGMFSFIPGLTPLEANSSPLQLRQLNISLGVTIATFPPPFEDLRPYVVCHAKLCVTVKGGSKRRGRNSLERRGWIGQRLQLDPRKSWVGFH